MYAQKEKPKENKSRAVTDAVVQKKINVKQGFGFVDNRPEAIAQRKLQGLIKNSPKGRQGTQFQAIADNYSARQQPIQKKENNTGLPDNLKSGIESLSGYSMDDVKVHRNSDKPAQLQAHAYAQGTDIHIASGQEKHLPHEAWHVVQQAQGRVKPTVQMKGGVPVNDDKGLEHEADVMGAKAMQMKAELSQFGIGTANIQMNLVSPNQNLSTLNARNGVESGKLVQRVERKAQVTWAITHLAKVEDPGEDESLFGKGDDWQSTEVSPVDLGQLSHDQWIIVDDEAVFMSRRGANQENPVRRKHDKETDELKHKWLKVLQVGVDGGFKPAPEDAYVRAETIKLIEVPKPPRKDIKLHEHGSEDEDGVSKDLAGFNDAWKLAATKRRRSIGRVKMDFEGQKTENKDDITSGWNWDQYDEGVDVSGYMKEPKERETFEGVSEQRILSANYDTEQGQEPIAYMVLEVRTGDAGPYMYIRWLIAHPDKGGGGSGLMKDAISRFKDQSECTEIRVESALSAVGWYESMGFKKVNPEKSAVKKGVGSADTELVYK